MHYLKIAIGILIVLSASRLIPHPPNFTSLLALSFYVPAFFGRKFIPAVILSFLLTDLIIGLHNTIFFTWGSVLIIGLMSKYLANNIFKRIGGALFGAVIFFIVTNFGVWVIGAHDLSSNNLINTYTLGIPFFGYSLISTLLFSVIIEGAHSLHSYIFLKKI
tara:strand:- start:744 stop:1229 length:486 start_codon:yes stop_codon:yes gene_type:complete